MIDGVVDFGLEDIADPLILLLVLAGLLLEDVAPVHEFPPPPFPLALGLLELHPEVSDGAAHLDALLLLHFQLLLEGGQLVVVVVVGLADHAFLLGQVALVLADQVVELVHLVFEVCVVGA